MDGLNSKRMDQIASRSGASKFSPGDRVRRKDFDGMVGVIDVAYIDYAAAASLVVPGWYEMQKKPLRTSKDGRFYSVILADGAILAGEDDLICAACEEDPCQCCEVCKGPCQGH